MSRERTPPPGVTWEQQLHQVEQVVSPEDDGESPFGWRDLPDTTVSGGNEPLPPQPNRATRRATKRATKRANRKSNR